MLWFNLLDVRIPYRVIPQSPLLSRAHIDAGHIFIIVHFLVYRNTNISNIYTCSALNPSDQISTWVNTVSVWRTGASFRPSNLHCLPPQHHTVCSGSSAAKPKGESLVSNDDDHGAKYLMSLDRINTVYVAPIFAGSFSLVYCASLTTFRSDENCLISADQLEELDGVAKEPIFARSLTSPRATARCVTTIFLQISLHVSYANNPNSSFRIWLTSVVSTLPVSRCTNGCAGHKDRVAHFTELGPRLRLCLRILLLRFCALPSGHATRYLLSRMPRMSIRHVDVYVSDAFGLPMCLLH